MGIKKTKFEAELDKLAKVGLDSSIFIYHLEDLEPYSGLTEMVFAAIGGGSLAAAISTLSVTELLVRPFTEGQMDRVQAFEQFIQSFPDMALLPPTYPIAKEAARLRGQYNLRTPDALLMATALSEKANAFLTNDYRLRKLKDEGISILVLDDYI